MQLTDAVRRYLNVMLYIIHPVRLLCPFAVTSGVTSAVTADGTGSARPASPWPASTRSLCGSPTPSPAASPRASSPGSRKSSPSRLACGASRRVASHRSR
jgi:hypothetical protein